MNLVQCGLLHSDSNYAIIYSDSLTADLWLSVANKYLLFTEIAGYDPIYTEVDVLKKLLDYYNVEGIIRTNQYIITIDGNEATFLDYDRNKIKSVMFDFLEN